MTGIICAMTIEAENIIAEMENVKTEKISGIEYTIGILYGKEIVVAVCGVGKVFAAACAQTMILKYSPAEVINVGVAGSLVPELKVFDIAVAEELCQHDMNTSALGDPVGLISGINIVKFPACKRINDAMVSCIENCGLNFCRGTIASGDLFVVKDKHREKIKSEFNALACEMEGAAIAQICYINSVDFAVLRAISDSEEGDYQKFAKAAADNSAKIIKEYIKNI
ncbi:MAG: 5'-methylthioadenosine/adenosylhomocysteine nucleosidase [Ruminococcaceae bacterium]|nr:5'-methylthioadenosine/adenosylhomocysteine nucleosidase [Oscillospiraceae bacterium]